MYQTAINLIILICLYRECLKLHSFFIKEAKLLSTGLFFFYFKRKTKELLLNSVYYNSYFIFYYNTIIGL